MGMARRARQTRPVNPGQKRILKNSAQSRFLPPLASKGQVMTRTAFSRILAAAAFALSAAAMAAVVGPAFAQSLPEGKGKDQVQMICTGCHDLSPITEGGFSKEDWNTVIMSMIGMGADIKPDQVPVLVDYLTTNFPPKK
jgi:hypothetical protein